MEEFLPETQKRKRISAENFGALFWRLTFDRAGRCSVRAIRILNTIMPLESGLVDVWQDDAGAAGGVRKSL
jgi:hypothetical protein